VKPEYGDSTMEKLAEKLGIKLSTLSHYRTVYRAWKDILPPGAKFPFAVLKELAAVPNRAGLLMAEPNMSKRRAEVLRVLRDHKEIIAAYPNLTCSNKARKIRSKYDEGDATWRTEPTEQADDDQIDNDDDEGEADDAAPPGATTSPPADQATTKGAKANGGKKKGNEKHLNDWLIDKSKTWLNKLAARNTDITGDAETRHQPLTPEQLHGLVVALAAAPSLPEQMRNASDKLREHADWFDSLKDEARKTATREGRIARSPKPASSEPAQAPA
jgi:hypothetical protein